MNMSKEKKPFLPIILGTDMNAYTMSISFYEEYGIKPILVGRMPIPFTEGSTLIDTIYYDKKIDDPAYFVAYLQKLAALYKTTYEKLILIGTNDFYVSFIIENRITLEKDFLFNYIDEKLFPQLYLKKSFYKLCEEFGIDTPLTFFHSCKNDQKFEEEIPFPVIVKPSNGVEYYNHPFEGMHKVYKAFDHEELNEIIDMIKGSGYTDDLIIQDFIPGDDTYMWDSVYYGNQHGKGQFISFAQVILQEHTKTGIGNYTALIVRHNEEMMKKLAAFLDSFGYKGFANFDIKYDRRDGKFKVFEVNIRQGRSSFYLTQCGYNLARFFVDDLVYDQEKEMVLLNDHQLFSVVPKGVLRRYIPQPQIVDEVNTLIKEGKFCNPLFNKRDKSLKRRMRMTLRHINYFRKYKKFTW